LVCSSGAVQGNTASTALIIDADDDMLDADGDTESVHADTDAGAEAQMELGGSTAQPDEREDASTPMDTTPCNVTATAAKPAQ
jgi:hypothetical protein